MSIPDYKKKYCIKCNELKENAQLVTEHDEYICIRCWLRKEGVNSEQPQKINREETINFVNPTSLEELKAINNGYVPIDAYETLLEEHQRLEKNYRWLEDNPSLKRVNIRTKNRMIHNLDNIKKTIDLYFNVV